MSIEYVTVAESNAPDAESEEFQLESDGSLLMSTLRVRYPSATGLRYLNSETNAFRTLKVQDDRILPPTDELGWKDRLFFIVLPKGVLDVSVGQETSPENRKRPANQENGSNGDRKHIKLDVSETSGASDSRPPCVDLLVRGMPANTTEEEVQDVFSKYGELVTVDVKTNRRVERPRGAFGFIRFKNREVQRQVLLKRTFNMSGTNVTVQRADMKKYADVEPLRLFVTKLSEGSDLEQKLRDYFTKFGKITDLFIPRKNFRGYAFITFELPDSVLEAIDEGENHTLSDGSRIVATLASPRQPGKGARADDSRSRPFMSAGDTESRGMRSKPYAMGRDMGSSSGMNVPMSRNYNDYGSRGYSDEVDPIPPAEDVAQAFYSVLHQLAGQNPDPSPRFGYSSGRSFGGGRRGMR